jgi:hypothetical protein
MLSWRRIRIELKGFLRAHQGRFAEAITELEVSLEPCRIWRVPAWFSNIASVFRGGGRTCHRLDQFVAKQ